MSKTGHFTAADVIRHAEKNKVPIIDPQLKAAWEQSNAVVASQTPVKSKRALKKHREPNETEQSFADLYLAPQLRHGDIIHYGFEEITLRWGDMEYTPDYFVIRRQCTVQYAGLALPGELPGAHMIEAVYVELKGGHKWEDSIVKFKSFRRAMRWATFECHQRVGGQWERVA